MLSGRDIILISTIEWDFNWQGHQEIASRLARAGNRVLYIENMGVRAPGLHDVRRVAQRFRHWTGSLLSDGVRFPERAVISDRFEPENQFGPLDGPRVEVHTIQPEFDDPTLPEGDGL